MALGVAGIDIAQLKYVWHDGNAAWHTAGVAQNK